MSNSLSAVHPELVAEWSDRNLPLTPDSITFGSNKKVWWKGACGHEWETSVKARSNGEKCPICSGARVVTGINDLSTLKPELASEWSEKNKIKPTEVSIGSHKKVIWKCKLEHEWIATVKSRSINRTGCPYCSHNKVLAGFNDLATLFPEVADEWSDRNENSPTEVMAFANSKAWWKCRTCGYEWNTLISTRSGGSKCPCCSGYTFIKGKNALFASLTPNYAYVDKETQKSISRYIVSTGDVLISIVGTIGLTAIVDSTLDKANLTENCVKVTNLKHITPEYLLLYLRSQLGREAIAKGTVGAVQQKLPIKNIQAIPIPLLSEKDKNALFCTLDSIFAGISNNVIQSAKLASLRDTLLPRLMSGELDVSDIDH